jgi:hypothetical protein
MSVFIHKSLWYGQVIMVFCNSMFVLHRQLYSGFSVATEYGFIYVFVCPKTGHTFCFNTALPLYKISAMYYIACKALLLSLPSITFLSVIPFHPTLTQKLPSPQNYAPTQDADRHPAHSDTAGFHK